MAKNKTPKTKYKYLCCIWCGVKQPLSKTAMYCSKKCRKEATGK